MPRETRHERPDLSPAATLVYGPGSPNQVADLYAPDRGGPWPLIVAIHGGAFMRGNRRRELPHVPELLERGYAVASIEYRLSGEALFPAAVQDVKQATAHLRAHGTPVALHILHDARHADQRFESELTQPAIGWLEGLRKASSSRTAASG